MKNLTVTIIGLFSALSMQAQDLPPWDPPLQLDQYGIVPTRDATLAELSANPWWGSPDLAKTWADNYARALFSWAKYNGANVEDLPLIFFAYETVGNNNFDTWVENPSTDQMFQEGVNSRFYLLGVDLPRSSVPDAAPVALLMGIPLLGLGTFRRLVIYQASKPSKCG